MVGKTGVLDVGFPHGGRPSQPPRAGRAATMRTGLTYFLIVLLVTACLDDTWAAATPETFDDVQADEDNHSLRPAPRPPQRRHPGKQQPAAPAPRDARSRGTAPAPGSPQGPQASPRSGTVLLY